MTPAKIKLEIASAFQSVAVYAGRPRVEDAGMEGVAPRGLGIGRAGVKSCPDTQVKPMIFIDRAQQIKSMAFRLNRWRWSKFALPYSPCGEY